MPIFSDDRMGIFTDRTLNDELGNIVFPFAGLALLAASSTAIMAEYLTYDDYPTQETIISFNESSNPEEFVLTTDGGVYTTSAARLYDDNPCLNGVGLNAAFTEGSSVAITKRDNGIILDRFVQDDTLLGATIEGPKGCS